MPAFGFCIEFTVPSDVDIGHPRRATSPTPNPIVEEVESMVDGDDRCNLLRVQGSNPTLLVCVAVDALVEESARIFAEGAVEDIVKHVVPGARFVRIDPTNPDRSPLG